MVSYARFTKNSEVPQKKTTQALAMLLSLALVFAFPIAMPEKAYAASKYTDPYGISWSYSLSGGEATIKGFDGAVDDLVIPPVIIENGKDYPVTTIEPDSQTCGFTTTTVPSSVKYIGANSFSQCDD